MLINAEILTLGRELLIGKTINTNGSWLAQRLTSIGVEVKRICVVGDTNREISRALEESLGRIPSIIITTGGLGSTYDDLTLEGVASALYLPLELNKRALEQVRRRYLSLGLEMTPSRCKMAMMPEGATPMANGLGSAPGMYMEYGDIMLFCLPGVPREMMEMFDSQVLARIRKKAPPLIFRERSFEIDGMPESSLAPLIEDWVRSHPRVYLKSHPGGTEGQPVITIHLSATGGDVDELDRELLSAEESFSNIVIRARVHGEKGAEAGGFET